MEVEGIERIWKRSVERLKLRFSTLISDGDSKGFENLVAIEPDVNLLKHECVGHVQKRLGTAQMIRGFQLNLKAS